jgi:hypothetical protein
MTDIIVREPFEPCDLCPAPDPNQCPAEHHEFYCEYVDAESRKPEQLRYYTRFLSGQTPKTKTEPLSASVSSPSKQPQPVAKRQMSVTMEEWNIADSLRNLCEHRIVYPRTATSCCRAECKIGKGKNPNNVHPNECIMCKLVEIGAIPMK